MAILHFGSDKEDIVTQISSQTYALSCARGNAEEHMVM
jgi:hypothetical protein